MNADITGNAEFDEEVTLKENAYTHSDVIESKFEVTSISGTITPA